MLPENQGDVVAIVTIIFAHQKSAIWAEQVRK